ncbi:MAG TPA: UDP-N-acetylmuramoyl-tripeptide--D-alanyl-D-alanine ligase [Thermomicrobiales bacterium]|nr:UDP-N-acetylmuramoylalanyl-D-glutamate--2,6-diaminopimelate ligase [Chloroflexota bacterium]HCG30873.1 UDP-N-acetylmuramoylalanyl-D-glutamate--2,6-diaminopimelate ligase [Chloroflexota bacterium]HQZ89203.1 UDP-N-acetylmuramoyl-tripeptide--D-alanyl-D-alanine ligase [Thermomicrobiales bacterium]HRA32224.1 UDP-N-acetylmuramoyl-tripeptide--D-alanyl-D-alanine ligase [Thermomicrobiales bacterium]
MIRVHDILAGTHGRLFGSISRNDLLARVVHDSRDVDKGDLFIALKGERTDGHRFVPDALEAGAGAVMVDESWFRRFDLGDLPVIVVPDTLVALQSLAAYWRSLFSEARVIGITGSIGKSSTKEVISAVLAQRYEVTRSRKSFNNEIGLPLSVLEMTPDTDVVVLEMGGAYAFGEIGHLAQIARPTIGVVTNVSHSHLGRMGSLDAIAKTKTELVEALPADGLAVLNIDDRRVRAMAERAKCRVVYYGTDPAADYYATELESHGIEGISFTLHHGDVQSYVSVPLMGRHSVHMALVGVAIGTELGLSLADILRGFQAPDIQLRLLLLPGVNGSTVLDDSYNANPASCVAALNLLAELDATRRVAVFGDMYELGTYEEEGHRRVGGRAAETVDALYTMGPLARLIAAEAVKARPDLPVEMFDDKRALEDALRRDLRPGDLVLIKGSRGLELETLVSALRNQMAEETD